MALPSSIFATPGAVALGVSGVVQWEEDHDQAGLQIAWVARTADLAHLKAPCFGMLTVKNKQNKKQELARKIWQQHDAPVLPLLLRRLGLGLWSLLFRTRVV